MEQNVENNEPLLEPAPAPTATPLTPVAIHVIDGHGYVWDADGKAVARENFKLLVFFYLLFDKRQTTTSTSSSEPPKTHGEQTRGGSVKTTASWER